MYLFLFVYSFQSLSSSSLHLACRGNNSRHSTPASMYHFWTYDVIIMTCVWKLMRFLYHSFDLLRHYNDVRLEADALSGSLFGLTTSL